MARIVVGAVWATIVRADAVETRVINDTLCVDTPDADQTYAFKSGRWDGKTRFLRRPNNEFLAGLIYRVVGALKAGGLPVEIVWHPVEGCSPLCGELDVQLREYQAAAVDRVIAFRRAAIQCPTGGGKTEIGFEIARKIGHRTLWVTHRKVLLDQTIERFNTRSEIKAGVIIGKSVEVREFTVGMVQTLHRILHEDKNFFRQFGTVIFDEGHLSAADTWQALGQECVNAHYRYALSGTIDEVESPVNRLKIEGMAGPTITISTTIKLAGDGFLATPRIVLLRPDPASYPTYEDVRQAVCPKWRDDPRQLQRLGGALFRVTYERGIIENQSRNKIAVETAARHAAAGEKFLVLCNRILHAERIAAGLRARGCVTWFLDGGASEDERRMTLRQFRQSEVGGVLVATPFFREGVDVPQIDAGMLAGGGESDIAVLQALGRMLRPRPDKPEVLIYDFIDRRDDPRDRRRDKEYLAIHSASRIALYREQGFEVAE